MTDAKCTFGTRPDVDINRLNDVIQREVKHFRIYDTYTPHFGSTPVSTKFYAAHDQLTVSAEDTQEEEKKVNQYSVSVAQTRALGPRSKYQDPLTENMVYGWYTKPVYPMDRNDRRFFYLRRECDIVKAEALIRVQNPKSHTK